MVEGVGGRVQVGGVGVGGWATGRVGRVVGGWWLGVHEEYKVACGSWRQQDGKAASCCMLPIDEAHAIAPPSPTNAMHKAQRYESGT